MRKVSLERRSDTGWVRPKSTNWQVTEWRSGASEPATNRAKKSSTEAENDQ